MLGWMSWGDKSGQRQKKGSVDDGVARSKPLGAAMVVHIRSSKATVPKICKQGNVIWGVGDVVYGIYGICLWDLSDPKFPGIER
ncbi:hypothetical protein RHMOL_Rhmol02G0110200 [Rhododendron molle]|uniref:Uncharacterized protein n=1 Tax=Rhododendron molle TaxID=49168 RepID=A0ACC0PRJ1_RHOML|nr:hypothetical protein RHMOL_Rhmol02G0110200 [Rhododendron molle]